VLNSLTSPATDHSAKLAAAARNLQEVQLQMTKAREMMECAVDCEPPITQLLQSAKSLQKATMMRKAQEKNKGVTSDTEMKELDAGEGDLNVMGSIIDVDQDVVDEAKMMMEALKDAYLYFDERKVMKNSDLRMDEIKNLYNRGVAGMCILINVKLSDAGKAIRLKKTTYSTRESAQQTRNRLTTALNDRTLLQSVGEYEEFLPFNRDEVHFQRVIFETLGDTNPRLAKLARSASLANKPSNTEDDSKAGPHTKVLNSNIDTGYMHLDTYAKTRKVQAYNAIDGYYRKLNNERKEEVARNSSDADDFDLEARDVVRCFEHAMVVIVGEQTVFRNVVAPSAVRGFEDGDFTENYRAALSSAYSHVAACVMERVVRIVDSTFYKQAKAAAGSVLGAGAASAAGLRILDGVRILGPTLAKHCDLSDQKAGMIKTEESKAASNLCIELHRVTVKGCQKAMENLTANIIDDPLEGARYRPSNAGVASVSSEVVTAVRMISKFTSAYKTVSKRRALSWDPQTGDSAGDLDAFSKYIVSKLCKNLEEKSKYYLKDGGFVAVGKRHIFMIVNMHFLLEKLKAPSQQFSGRKSRRVPVSSDLDGEEDYKITGSWFKQKVGGILEKEKAAYLDIWQSLNEHIVQVESGITEKERNRLLKARFSGFIEGFERLYFTHNKLIVSDDSLCRDMRVLVKEKFLHRYSNFFETYSKVQFSKKKQDEYIKYKPEKVEGMINELFEPPVQSYS